MKMSVKRRLSLKEIMFAENEKLKIFSVVDECANDRVSKDYLWWRTVNFACGFQNGCTGVIYCVVKLILRNKFNITVKSEFKFNLFLQN